ncbi:hypothetical protein MPER_12923 [Moniliophthora perniciosa FA553]|nr:hypothetical protein MPER_12923 [Moniliophthora perniciosa FA553]
MNFATKDGMWLQRSQLHILSTSMYPKSGYYIIQNQTNFIGRATEASDDLDPVVVFQGGARVHQFLVERLGPSGSDGYFIYVDAIPTVKRGDKVFAAKGEGIPPSIWRIEAEEQAGEDMYIISNQEGERWTVPDSHDPNQQASIDL